MVAHADHGHGHHHEEATKAHGCSEWISPPPIDFPGNISLGEKGKEEGKAPEDAHFGWHIKIHIVRVENEHVLILDEEIVFRVRQEIGAPTDAKEWMFFDHGFGAFPKGEA